MKRYLTIGLLAALGAFALIWARSPQAPPPPALATLWDEAGGAASTEAWEQARDLYERWIAEAAKEGIRSPEAHFNLGLVYWKLNQPTQACLALLHSLLTDGGWGTSYRAGQSLAAIQKEIGVTGTVVEETRFRLRIWLPPEKSLWLALTSFWMLLGLGLAVLYGWTLPRRALALAIVPAAGLALSVVADLSRKGGAQWAVLNHPTATVALYPEPRLDPQEKLLDLPSGTLVLSSDEQRNGFQRIESPIYAWVPAEELLRPQ